MERPAETCSFSGKAELSASAEALPPLEARRRQLEDNVSGGSSLNVYVRIRPRVGGRPFADPTFRPCNDTTVESTTATRKHQHQKRFSFTKVFPEGSSQEQVFQEAVQDRVDAFVKGANVLLFAYGPTASGKTHTMEGPPTDPGVVPRTIERVFRLLGPGVCQEAPVRPVGYDDVASFSAEEKASVLSLKRKLLDQEGARSAADFSAFHPHSNNSDGSPSGSCDSSYSDKAQQASL
ncbi:kinesin-like protein KIFC2 [Dermacentor silvarum]|uniref:kinesin-like protein KIFC2 n=1 Tax=Dermacentor silvarum TaxID=543639 RepID=UPI0021017E2A|nr:kinesin-like protein KIFC2 [Dermacentor silvarum]